MPTMPPARSRPRVSCRRIAGPASLTLPARGIDERSLGVGIGIDSGMMKFGEFGRSHRDLTAIGTVVNIAARAQSTAPAGTILVTQRVYDRTPELAWNDPGRDHVLKGIEAPVRLYVA